MSRYYFIRFKQFFSFAVYGVLFSCCSRLTYAASENYTGKQSGKIVSFHLVDVKRVYEGRDKAGMAAKFNDLTPIRWSPDSKKIALSGVGGLYVIDIENNMFKKVSESTTRNFDWMLDSRRVVILDSPGWAQSGEIVAIDIISGQRTILESGADDVNFLTVTRSSEVIFLDQGKKLLHRIQLGGAGAKSILALPACDDIGVVLKDGSRVLYGSQDGVQEVGIKSSLRRAKLFSKEDVPPELQSRVDGFAQRLSHGKISSLRQKRKQSLDRGLSFRPVSISNNGHWALGDVYVPAVGNRRSGGVSFGSALLDVEKQKLILLKPHPSYAGTEWGKRVEKNHFFLISPSAWPSDDRFFVTDVELGKPNNKNESDAIDWAELVIVDTEGLIYPLTDTKDKFELHPSWSPDCKSIAYVCEDVKLDGTYDEKGAVEIGRIVMENDR